MIWYIVIGLFISAFCFITYLAMNAPLMPDDYNEEGIDLDYENDKDVNDFLNDPANNQEPHEMGDTHEYIKGGLTYDKDESFKVFQNKMKQNDEWDEDHALDQVLNEMVRATEDYGDNFEDGVDEQIKKEPIKYNDSDDSNEY